MIKLNLCPSELKLILALYDLTLPVGSPCLGRDVIRS